MTRLEAVAAAMVMAGAACGPRPERLPDGPWIALSASSVTLERWLGGPGTSTVVEVSNVGSGVLATPDIEVRYAGTDGWLRATLAATDEQLQLRLSTEPEQVPPQGTYHTTVVLTAPGAVNSPVVLAVRYDVFALDVVSTGPNFHLDAAYRWPGVISPAPMSIFERNGAPLPAPATAVTYAGAGGWLEVAVSGGDGRWDVQRTVHPEGLERGTYEATVTADLGWGGTVQAPAWLTVDDWGGSQQPCLGATLALPPGDRVLCVLNTSSAGVWRPFADAFTPIEAPAPEDDWGSSNTYLETATLLSDGTVLLTGQDESNVPMISRWKLLDPSTGKWLAAGALDHHLGYTAVLLKNGQVLLPDAWPATATSVLFDPATRRFIPMGYRVRKSPSALVVRLADGRVLVAGGWDYSGQAPRAVATAEVYDPATARWTATTPMRAARGEASGVLLPDGRVLVAGGKTENGFLATAETFDPATATWTQVGSMSRARAGFGGLLPLPDGTILAAGGCAGDPNVWCDPVDGAERFDPSTGTWLPWATLPRPWSGRSQTIVESPPLLMGGFVFLTDLGGGGLDNSAVFRRADFP